MNLYRREIAVPFLLPVVLLLMGSEFSPEDKVGRWKDPFEAARYFREAGRPIPVWKPGGIRVSENEALAFMAQPKVQPLVNTVVQSEGLGSSLVFPHIADGRNQAANLQITTSIVLINTGNRDSELVVKFFRENGTPMETSVGGVVGNEFSFSLQRGQSLRVKTDGSGPIQAGWAKVRMSQPVGGTATFALTDLGGNLNAEVGVDRALLETDFALFAEADGVTNTGVALPTGMTPTRIR